jgi:dipeptidyl aminopeptidase/acylaminoacyl peptidase
MRIGIIIALAGALLLAAVDASAAPPPIDAYGKLPRVTDVEISPDGKRLVFKKFDGQTLHVVVSEVGGGVVKDLAIGDRLHYVGWAGPDHLIIELSTTVHSEMTNGKTELYVLHDYNLAKQTQTQLMKDVRGATQFITGYLGVRMLNGQPFAFVTALYAEDQDTWVRDALFRVNLETNDTRLVEMAPQEIEQDWAVDAEGKPVASTQFAPSNRLWKLRLKVGADWRERVVETAGTDVPELTGLGRDARTVLLAREDEGTHYLQYSLDNLAAPPVELPSHNGDFINDPRSYLTLGDVEFAGDTLRQRFYDPKDQAAWDAAIKPFKGSIVTLSSWSDDRRKLVLRVDDPAAGPAYALVDLVKGAASYIAEEYPDIDQDGVSEVRPVSYKAKDGLTITGYLTLPRGKDAKNLPLVVLTHGGPGARDEPGFDWWAQAIASRGYAVLQPNFRGSMGFDHDFFAAGFGEWGRRMQTDLSDGVRDLADRGVADPKRVCIVGASYGGYAALAGATIDTGVYRCAASVAGVSDLKRMLSNDLMDRFKNDTTMRWWVRYMGVSGPGDPKLAEISPIDHVDKVTIPILLIHGDEDTTVPYEQSQVMEAALKRAGKNVAFVTLKHETHYLATSETRVEMLKALIAFLEANNPPN